jgi:hypothetical protein
VTGLDGRRSTAQQADALNRRERRECDRDRAAEQHESNQQMPRPATV